MNIHSKKALLLKIDSLIAAMPDKDGKTRDELITLALKEIGWSKLAIKEYLQLRFDENDTSKKIVNASFSNYKPSIGGAKKGRPLKK